MYVDLKLFRLEHDNMFQSDLGELFGVGQSVISRMEKQFAELNEVQYKKLCERFGEEEVQKYVRESPLKNVMDSSLVSISQPSGSRATTVNLSRSFCWPLAYPMRLGQYSNVAPTSSPDGM